MLETIIDVFKGMSEDIIKSILETKTTIIADTMTESSKVTLNTSNIFLLHTM